MRSSKKTTRIVKSTNKKHNGDSRVIAAPAAFSNRITYMEPQFMGGKPGCIRLKKTEFIADILGPDLEFEILAALAINPGSPVCFPWLSSLAVKFESYKFYNLHFELRTQAPTDTAGYLAIVPDYQASDPPPSNKAQALENEETVRGPIWADIEHIAMQKNLNKRLSYYTREGAIPSNTAIDLFDVGNLYVLAGSPSSGSSPVSELWVTYDIELQTPQFESGPDTVGELSSTTGETTTNPFGNEPVSGGALSTSWDPSTGYLTFNTPYEGIVEMVSTGTGLVANLISLGSGGEVTLIKNIANTAGTSSMSSYLVNVIAGAQLLFGITGTTVTDFVARFTAYDDALGSISQHQRVPNSATSITKWRGPKQFGFIKSVKDCSRYATLPPHRWEVEPLPNSLLRNPSQRSLAECVSGPYQPSSSTTSRTYNGPPTRGSLYS